MDEQSINNSRLAIAMRFRQVAAGADFFEKMEAAVMFMLCETAQFEDVDERDLEQLIAISAERMRKNWSTFVEAAKLKRSGISATAKVPE